MKKYGTLTNIKSNYCMKFIFAFLEYNYILKLIKYNKKLQKILDISLNNYKQRITYLYLTQKYKPEFKKEDLYEQDYEKYLSNSFTAVLILISVYNTKAVIISAIIYLVFMITKIKIKERYKMINRIANIILLFFFCIYLIEIIFGITLIIIEHKFSEVRLCLIFICNISYTILCLIIIYRYYIYIYIKTRIIAKNYLLQINNTNINKYALSSDFHKMSNLNKKKYILKNLPHFIVAMTREQIDIIKMINDIRLNKNISQLEYNETSEFYDFLLKEPSELYLFPYKKTFMLSQRKYLIKCKKDEFKVLINENNNDIMKVLLMEDLDRIFIFEKKNIIYILVYESYDDYIDINNNNNNDNNVVNENELIDNDDFSYHLISVETKMGNL
jgi:hypothetical protein